MISVPSGWTAVRWPWKGRQDKGHRAAAIAFRRAVLGEAALPTDLMIATMRATIRAAQGSGCGG